MEMEGSAWKVVLLEWANLSGFLDRKYFNLNQTDIECFYQNFKSHLNAIVSVNENDCLQFLKEYYPQFEPHLSDDGQLSSEDYMYVYSIFLHFSCVKYPLIKCQEICKNMKENTQYLIATFLKILVAQNKFNKETLRSAISEAAPENYASLHNVTPIKLTTEENNISPPTPKSKMLEDWNIEIKSLKVQLATERYERGFIEVQVKQFEDKNKKLLTEQRQFINEIHDLKSSLLELDTQNISPNKNSQEEQAKHRLRKEIAEKDGIIAKFKLKINDLIDEKSSLADEIKYTKEQYDTIQQTAYDLDFKLKEIKSENEQKEETIKYLQSLNHELEFFISESKGVHKPTNLDLSIENLNFSFPNIGNRSPSVHRGSSSSSNSPENLGRSVVDVQLRDEKIKNKELSETIKTLNDDNKKITSNLTEFIKKYSLTIEVLDISDLLLNNDDLSKNFMIFINYFEKLVNKYQNLKTDLNSVQTLNQQIDNENIDLKLNIAKLENSNDELQQLITSNVIQLNENKIQIDRIIEEQLQMQKINTDLKKLLAHIEQKVCEKELYSKKVIENYDKLKITYENVKELLSDYQKQINVLENSLNKTENLCETYKKNCELLKKDMEIQRNTMKEMLDKVTSEKTEIINLNTINEQKLLSIKNELLEANVESDKLKLEILENNKIIVEQTECIDNLKDCNTKIYNESIKSNKALDILIDNNNKFANDNKMLTEKLDTIQVTYDVLNTNFKNLNMDYIQLKDEIADKEIELNNLNIILDEKSKTIQLLQSNRDELINTRFKLENDIKKFNQVHFELKNNISELENNKIKLSQESLTINQTINQMQNYIDDLEKLKITFGKERVDYIEKESEFIAALNQLKNEKLIVYQKKLELEKENQQLIETIAILQKQLQEVNIIRNELEAEKLTLTTDYEEILFKNDKLTEEVSDLKMASTNVETVVKDLNKSIELLEIKNNDTKNKLNTLQVKNETLNNTVINKQKEFDNLQLKSIEEKAELLKVSEEKQLILNQRIEEYQKEIAALNQKLGLSNNLEIEIVKLQHKLQEDMIIITELEAQKLSKSTELKELLTKNDKLTEQLSTLNETLNNTVINNQKAYKNDQINYIDEKTKLLKVSGEKQLILYERIEEYYNEISILKKKLTSVNKLKLDNLKLSNENKLIADDVKALRDTILTNNKLQNDLSEKNKSITITIDTLTKELELMKSKYEGLKSNNLETINNLQNNLEIQQNENKDLLLKINDIEEQLKINEKLCVDLQIRCDSIKKDNETFENLNIELKNQLNNKIFEIQNLEIQIKEYDNKSINVQKQFEKLNDSLISAKENDKIQLSAYENEIIKLKESIFELKTKLNNLLEEKVNLITQIEEKTIIQKQYENSLEKIDNCKEFLDEISQQIFFENTLNDDNNNNNNNNNNKIIDNLNVGDTNKTMDIKENKHQNPATSFVNIETKLHELEIISKQIEKKIKENHNKCIKLNQTNKNYEKQQEQYKENIEIIMKEQENLKIENINLKTDVKILNDKIENDKNVKENNSEKLVQKFLESEKLIENLETQITKLTEEKQDIIENHKILTVENAKLLSDRNELKEENQCINEQLTKSILKISILETNTETLRNKVVSIETTMTKEKIEMEQLQKTVNKIDANEDLMKTTKENELLYNQEKQLNSKLQQDVAILQAKLYKHRQITETKEKEWNTEKDKLEKTINEQKSTADNRIKENRIELEGKLEKMKAKMKELYNDEVSKIKTKNERENFELKTQNHQQIKKIEQYDEHVHKLSKQIFQLNEKQLNILKENEFMKSKIRMLENNTTSTSKRLVLPEHFKMEDEEGELFNTTYLNDLKSDHHGGRISPTGRVSVRFSELQFRNSLCPPHLRSAYAAQYHDQDFREDEIKSPQYSLNFAQILLGNCLQSQSPQKIQDEINLKPPEMSLQSLPTDESFISSQSEVRRGTIYKRPGPPTPSKNGGRLSLGAAGELAPREILKEQQNINVAATAITKKTTPGKLRAMFTSSKVKDENSTPTRRRLSIFKSRSNR